ncbi:MAG: hypothetical protein JWQ90_3108 [Hydrocarboniphaga sp.]|uniref:hypothetical protein n=1 Tax=Hydrocarboniphaga sp. TaxID=2033016 RepID=UPI00262E363F|nr:hypothetical protein [Hydrocarboniphaga sp.]MDB5970658.1 hypothetical protein [Hydrocarboniphaga sp.]
MSKIIITLGLAVLLAVPLSVLAQNESTASGDEPPPTADSPPVSTEPVADAVPADAVPADAATSDASSSGSADSSTTDTTSASSAASGSGETPDSSAATDAADVASSDAAASSGSDDGLKLYFGAERVEATLDLSKQSLEDRYGDDKLQGGFYRGRVGLRLVPGIAIEGQGGFLPDDDKASNDVKFKHFYAAYLVTTGTVLDMVEISGRVGWAWIGAKNSGADESFNSVSYGVEAAFPLRVISESLPDIRFIAGATVFTQDSKQRSYGWSYGLRYDFNI